MAFVYVQSIIQFLEIALMDHLRSLKNGLRIIKAKNGMIP